MPEPIQIIKARSNHPFIKVVAGCLIILLIIAIILFALNYFHKINLKKSLPFLPAVTTPESISQPKAVTARNLDTCAVTKEDNPLVESLSTKFDIILGIFKGKITDIKVDPIRKSHIISLTSLDNTQSYSFNIKDQEGTILTLKGQEASPSALKTNQIVKISFTCDKKSNGFKFTSIIILPSSSSIPGHPLPSGTVKK